MPSPTSLACISRRFLVAAVLALALSGGRAAQAELVLTLTRLSDTSVTISGVGSVGGSAGPYESITMLNSFPTSASGIAGLAGDFAIGAGAATLATQNANALLLAIVFGDADTPSGLAQVTGLAGSVLAAVGATGTVQALPQGGSASDIVDVGRWVMVAEPAAVPAPASFAVLAMGLLGLARARRLRPAAG